MFSESIRILRQIFFVVVLLAIACKKEVGKPAIDCNGLVIGIIDRNAEAVKPIVDDLAADLHPTSTPTDPGGQKANLAILVSRINSNCSNVNATINCYRCLYSNPPQSVVAVAADSAGVKVARSIMVITPDNRVLTCASVH